MLMCCCDTHLTAVFHIPIHISLYMPCTINRCTRYALSLTPVYQVGRTIAVPGRSYARICPPHLVLIRIISGTRYHRPLRLWEPVRARESTRAYDRWLDKRPSSVIRVVQLHGRGVACENNTNILIVQVDMKRSDLLRRVV